MIFTSIRVGSIDYATEIKLMEANAEQYRTQLEYQLIELKKHSDGKYDRIIGNCEKHIQLDRNIGKILRKFFDDLEINEYLRETKPLRMMAGVMFRNAITLRIIRSLGNPFLKNENSRFKELMKEEKFTDSDFTILYVTLVVHLWLDQTEFFKNMLLTVLNNKSKIECDVNDNDTLGTLLKKLEKKVSVDDLRNVIKPEFRNVLGHSKWWMQGDDFCYVNKDDKIVVLHKLEFSSMEMHLATLSLHFFAVLHEYYLMP